MKWGEARKRVQQNDVVREDRARVVQVWSDAAEDVKDVVRKSPVGRYADPQVPIRIPAAVAEKD